MAPTANCPKCGLPWIGTAKCECGWRPNNVLHLVTILVTVLTIAGIAGGIYLAQHFREYFPDQVQAEKHLAKGNDEFKRTNFPQAITEFREAAYYLPKEANIRKKLAWALLNDQRPSEALAEMKVAYRHAPRNETVRKDYSFMLEHDGEFDEAAKVLEALINDGAKEHALKFHLAELYEKGGNVPRAIAAYTDYCKIKPNVNGPWLGLARLQEATGHRKDGIATLRKGLSIMPGDAALRQQLGIALGDDNQIDEAVNELTRSAAMSPALAEYNANVIASLSQRQPKECVIPLHKRGSSYSVDAIINGKRKVRLIVDSGAESVAVSPAVLKDLEVSPANGELIVLHGLGGLALSKAFMLQSIQLGLAKEHLIQAVVIPPPGNNDGLLGMSFLKRYEFAIDA